MSDNVDQKKKRPSFQNANRGRDTIYSFLKNYMKQLHEHHNGTFLPASLKNSLVDTVKAPLPGHVARGEKPCSSVYDDGLLLG